MKIARTALIGGDVHTVNFNPNTDNFTAHSYIGNAASCGPLCRGTFIPIVTTNDTSLDGSLNQGLGAQNQTVRVTVSRLTVGKVY